ncbi:MAG: cache domain-containing protein [Ignavibacteria bacterium]|nr:cache domain-containing protein [Ignavibacteria bacterium]
MNTRLFWLHNRIFVVKILLPAFLTLILFIVSLYYIIIPQFENIIMERKREMIRELTNTAWHVADRYHQEVVQGRMTREDAQGATIAQIRHLRYGVEGKDYFWITDFQPVMIMHPFRGDLNGKPLTDFTDSHGKRLFVEIAKLVRERGDGFVDYTWQWKDDSTRIVPKLSFVKPFAPWGWIIGTGMYIDDVKMEIANLERDVITISVWITITISFLLVFILIQNVRSEVKRLNAENELRESKEKYEALVEATTEGLLMVLDGKQTYFNKTLLAMSGYTEEEAGLLDHQSLFPALQPDAIRAMDAPHAVRDGHNPHVETKLQRKDGVSLDVLLTVSPISFFGRTGVVVIVKDIGHHKQMATALDESREKFLALTNRLSLAVFRTDAGKEMRVVEANAATAMILGYSHPEELRGTPFSDHFEDPQTVGMMMKELFDTGFLANRITRCKKRDTTSIDISMSIALVRDVHGNAQYCDILAEDISRHKRIQEDTGTLLSELQAPLQFLLQPILPLVKELVACDGHDSLQKVTRMMSRIPTDVAMVRDEDGAFIGMVTSDDVREATLVDGFAVDRSVTGIMRSPLHAVYNSASVYDVLALHREKHHRCYPVKNESGVICGTVHMDDIQRSELHTYLFFVHRLQNAESIAEVCHCHARLLLYIRLLIESGADVNTIARAVTIISDSTARRLLELAIEELGPPPVKFAFIALGSEGRSEQTLVTDQDNAILYQDVESGKEELARDYFQRLGERVCNALDRAGYAFCKGNVMAKNPAWSQPYSVWKRNFSDWVNTANPQDLLEVSIFFDFRCIYGDESLTEKLRDHLGNITSGNNAFFVYLSENALRRKLPAWQFKTADRVDLKSALLPLVEIVRIYSLKNKIRSTNTLERLQRLREKDIFTPAGHRDIAQAYSFLAKLRYQSQAKSLAGNASAGNTAQTQDLADIEKLVLRRIQSQIEDFQTKLSLDFKGTL